MDADSHSAPSGRRLRHAVTEVLSAGTTPFYLLDLERVSTNLHTVMGAWRRYFPSVEVVYPYKTNPLAPITSIMRAAGCGAEVISHPELSWALADGFAVRQILYSGPAKGFEDICSAIVNGVHLQVDSTDEMLRIVRASEHCKKSVSVSIRLSCPLSDGQWSRFGVRHKEYHKIVEVFSNAQILVDGIHFHYGSNMASPTKLSEIFQVHLPILQSLLRGKNRPVRLNIGGGFGVPMGPTTSRRLFHEAFALAVVTGLNRASIPLSAVSLFIEPGRCLTEECGTLVSQVLHRKERHGKCLLGLNIGSNLIRAGLAGTHPISFLRSYHKSKSACYDLYGCLCFEPDLIQAAVRGPNAVRLDDVLLLGGVGAYAFPGAYPWSYESPRIFSFQGDDIREVKRNQRLGEVSSSLSFDP